MEDYQDRLAIATPEGVRLDLVLAGLGSRVTAGVVDLLIKAVVLTALIVVTALVGDLGLTVAAIAVPTVYLAYDVLFEVLAGGRTPGKRASGLRVLRADGRPVDALSSLIRNVVRLVDGLTLLYVPGMASILITRRNQRLGDLAASTIVVREDALVDGAPPLALGLDPAAAPLDVTQVTPQDLAALRAFLQRRGSLGSGPRADLASRLAGAVAPRVGGATAGMSAEELIARVVATKDAARR